MEEAEARLRKMGLLAPDVESDPDDDAPSATIADRKHKTINCPETTNELKPEDTQEDETEVTGKTEEPPISNIRTTRADFKTASESPTRSSYGTAATTPVEERRGPVTRSRSRDVAAAAAATGTTNRRAKSEETRGSPVEGLAHPPSESSDEPSKRVCSVLPFNRGPLSVAAAAAGATPLLPSNGMNGEKMDQPVPVLTVNQAIEKFKATRDERYIIRIQRTLQKVIETAAELSSTDVMLADGLLHGGLVIVTGLKNEEHCRAVEDAVHHIVLDKYRADDPNGGLRLFLQVENRKIAGKLVAAGWKDKYGLANVPATFNLPVKGMPFPKDSDSLRLIVKNLPPCVMKQEKLLELLLTGMPYNEYELLPTGEVHVKCLNRTAAYIIASLLSGLTLGGCMVLCKEAIAN